MSSSPVSLDGIVALVRKGNGFFMKNNATKYVECFARAAAQAEQLAGRKDSLVSAYLKTNGWEAAVLLAQSMSREDRAAAHKALHAEMVAVIGSLQRRKGAGTLLRGTEVERALYDACMSGNCLSTEPVSGAEALPGFVAFVVCASYALGFAVDKSTQQVPAFAQISSAEAQHLFDHVADALDLIGQTVAPDGSPLLFVGPAGTVVHAFCCEAGLMNTISRLESSFPLVRGTHPEAMHRFDEAWQRLSAGPVLRVRTFAERICDTAIGAEQALASRAEDLQRRVLRRCHLPACAKEEVHPSQFKHCSGCSAAAVVYCCREHQVADWPKHKAACKAARKGKGGEQGTGGAGKKESGGGSLP